MEQLALLGASPSERNQTRNRLKSLPAGPKTAEDRKLVNAANFFKLWEPEFAPDDGLRALEDLNSFSAAMSLKRGAPGKPTSSAPAAPHEPLLLLEEDSRRSKTSKREPLAIGVSESPQPPNPGGVPGTSLDTALVTSGSALPLMGAGGSSSAPPGAEDTLNSIATCVAYGVSNAPDLIRKAGMRHPIYELAPHQGPAVMAHRLNALATSTTGSYLANFRSLMLDGLGLAEDKALALFPFTSDHQVETLLTALHTALLEKGISVHPETKKVRWARLNALKASLRYVQDTYLGLSSIETCFSTSHFTGFWKGLKKRCDTTSDPKSRITLKQLIELHSLLWHKYNWFAVDSDACASLWILHDHASGPTARLSATPDLKLIAGLVDKKNLLHTMLADFKWLFHITTCFLGERRVSETPRLRFKDEVEPDGGYPSTASRGAAFKLRWAKNDTFGAGHTFYVPVLRLRRFINIQAILDITSALRRRFTKLFGYRELGPDGSFSQQELGGAACPNRSIMINVNRAKLAFVPFEAPIARTVMDWLENLHLSGGSPKRFFLALPSAPVKLTFPKPGASPPSFRASGAELFAAIDRQLAQTQGGWRTREAGCTTAKMLDTVYAPVNLTQLMLATQKAAAHFANLIFLEEVLDRLRACGAKPLEALSLNENAVKKTADAQRGRRTAAVTENNASPTAPRLVDVFDQAMTAIQVSSRHLPRDQAVALQKVAWLKIGSAWGKTVGAHVGTERAAGMMPLLDAGRYTAHGSVRQ